VKDKIVLIVGGTGGIGSATAKIFSEQGAKVVIAGRNRSKAEEIAKELNGNGGDAYAITVDVTNPVSVDTMTKEVESGLGKIDVLVNAFGQGLIQSFSDIQAEAAKEVLDVNIYGTFLVTQRVLQSMNTETPTNVIMFPGTMGKYVMKNSSVYAASKFAVQGFTKALVEELKREKVRFSLLYLGGVDTAFWDDDRVNMRVKKEAMLTTEAVAQTVLATVTMPGAAVVNEIVMQPESHQMV
jgi:NADP-dependent 3-hydroxy acid dehydrogenase YdfG